MVVRGRSRAGGDVLVLGGTAEARRLVERLEAGGRPCVLSLAGRTRAPLTAGQVRVGGFGGVDGLVAWLREHRPQAVVDATHPFAAQMTRHAAEACARVVDDHGRPLLLRLERPGWTGHALADTWTWVDSHEQAAAVAADLLECGARPVGAREVPAGARHDDRCAVLLTVGRQHTPDYLLALGDHRVVARVAEPVGVPLPSTWQQVVARGPFALDDERVLLQRQHVAVLVTKDAGGAHTAAKLQAAAEVGARVVVIHRPALPEGMVVVDSVDAAVGWVESLTASASG